MEPDPVLKSLTDNPLAPLPDDQSTCYLIGAGLSAASRFAVPTATGFLAPSFVKHIEGEDETIDLASSRPELKTFLSRIESRFGELSGLNIETVLTDLYVRSFGIGRSWEFENDVTLLTSPGANVERDYQLALAYIRERLPSFASPKAASCPLIKRFVETLRPGDSLVTLNYDEILEHHLAPDHGKMMCFRHLESLIAAPGSLLGGYAAPFLAGSHPGPGNGILAKLHGSNNWFTCSNRACPSSRYIQPFGHWATQGTQFYEAKDGFARCVNCGSPQRAVIVPPTAAKAFDDFPKLGVLWSRAYEAFRAASRWVLLGVSLATTDFHLGAFLRSLSAQAGTVPQTANRLEIVIADKDPKPVARRMLSVLAPRGRTAVTRADREFYVANSIEAYVNATEGAIERFGSASRPP